MDTDPDPTGARKLIESYGDGGFRIGGTRYTGSVLVFADRVTPWPVDELSDMTLAGLGEVTGEAPAVEILIVGCGAGPAPAAAALSGRLRGQLRDAGIVVDFMDTGAAARTFNVLLAEDRRVAAALVAVP